jgi:amphi-Trp domain-containing protein
VIENGLEARPRRGQIWPGRAGRRGSEAQVKLMELKDKTTLSREEAAARLHAIADELASGNDVVIEREDMRFVAHVPDQVNLKVEFEIEDDGTELEIELTW